MNTDSRTITRKQLFDLVWSKPIREVAPMLHLSDVGLAKLCDRNDVPRPAQGHWLRIQRGKRINKPKLPSINDEVGEVIQLPAEKQIALTASNITSIPVSSKTRTHPLVVRCRKDFNGAGCNEYGRLVCRVRKDVDVSKAQFSRALSLLNSILHSLEEDGHAVQWSTADNQIEVCVGEERISLSVSEPAIRSDHVLTPKELKDKKRYGTVWSKRWDYTPSGKLALALSGKRLYDVRSTWSDTKKETLKAQLPKILGGILRASEHMKLKRQEAEERKLQWAVQERRRRRLEKAQKLFQQRVDAVDQIVADYQKAEEIRACLAEMHKQGVVESMPTSKRRLLRWAEDLAKHLDPCNGFEFQTHQDLHKGGTRTLVDKFDQTISVQSARKKPI